MKQKLNPTDADISIQHCLDNHQSFSVVAGAGAGKTTSLIMALDFLRESVGKKIRMNGQQIACITYTNRAVEVIKSRLEFDNLFYVSTLHSFLWKEIERFDDDIRLALQDAIIPAHIAKSEEKDNGRQTQVAIKSRAKKAELEAQMAALPSVKEFVYSDTVYSDYASGLLSHDDVIELAAYLFSNKSTLQKAIGFKYPYMLIDEAQDTFESVVEALNAVCKNDGLPIIGYFGDPMQQIFDKRAGEFSGPEGAIKITKEENFRSSQSVINLLNAFRNDLKQIPAGNNKDETGSVEIVLAKAEEPEGERRRYTADQLERSMAKFNQSLETWGWNDDVEFKQLFLVRQMIARRLGFVEIHRLFTGEYASSRAQDQYEQGKHFLIKPFLNFICPLILAASDDNHSAVINLLRNDSPIFSTVGVSQKRPLKEMIELSKEVTKTLRELWDTTTVREILEYCEKQGICKISERLSQHLSRTARTETYDKETFETEKSDWLSDEFFSMKTNELLRYYEFFNENTPFTTQHGVKGEQYENVLVVFDDIEASWNNYSFIKTLTPTTSGTATPGQLERSRKLAYVCFSRAELNLRILLFTPNPDNAKKELIANKLFLENQIHII